MFKFSGTKSSRNVDVIIITDGGISNLSEVTDFLTAHQNYRPTIIHTGGCLGGFGLDIEGYAEENGVYDGIRIYHASGPKDLEDIAKKTMKRHLLSKFEVL